VHLWRRRRAPREGLGGPRSRVVDIICIIGRGRPGQGTAGRRCNVPFSLGCPVSGGRVTVASMPPRPFALAFALAALGACSDRSTQPAPTPSDAVPMALEAAAEPAPESAPVGPASILPLVRLAAVVESAGPASLAGDGEAVVDPGASFEIELGAAVPEVRLVLLDAHDAHVAAQSVRELGETTRLTLMPAAPLAPGARYVLRLEGLSTRDVRDADDRAYAPHSFALLVAGTPPPPEPKKPARRQAPRRAAP
jgi:hypothetical protein